MAGIQKLARRAGVPQEHVDQVFLAMTAMLEEGQTINIKGFASFKPVIREPRTIKSSALPGGQAHVPRQRAVSMKLVKSLKDKWKMEE